jgi:hypothetical protein
MKSQVVRKARWSLVVAGVLALGAGGWWWRARDGHALTFTAVITLLLSMSLFAARGTDTPALKLTKTIPLPGVKGRFDHFAMDSKNKIVLLFVRSR